ncbi:MAG: CDP-alcohol phosphatidyltransferase family protein [Chitinophagales bacterium]
MTNNSIDHLCKRIESERKRTNLLRSIEQPVLALLCDAMPTFVTPNMLTGIGLFANVVVFAGFYFGRSNPLFLGIAILGFAINWFGDSLDGRLAYYRNIPRKWYGFALDISMDWISTLLMGLGFYFFLPEQQKIVALLFIAAYSWSMIIALLKYKIAGVYQIDSGLFGPTELRIGICLVLFTAMFYPQIIAWFASVIIGVIMVVNFIWFYRVLKFGNERDRKERLLRKMNVTQLTEVEGV